MNANRRHFESLEASIFSSWEHILSIFCKLGNFVGLKLCSKKHDVA